MPRTVALVNPDCGRGFFGYNPISVIIWGLRNLWKPLKSWQVIDVGIFKGVWPQVAELSIESFLTRSLASRNMLCCRSRHLGDGTDMYTQGKVCPWLLLGN